MLDVLYHLMNIEPEMVPNDVREIGFGEPEIKLVPKYKEFNKSRQLDIILILAEHGDLRLESENINSTCHLILDSVEVWGDNLVQALINLLIASWNILDKGVQNKIIKVFKEKTEGEK